MNYIPYIILYLIYYPLGKYKLEEIVMSLFVIYYLYKNKFFLVRVNKILVSILLCLSGISIVKAFNNNYFLDRTLEQIILFFIMFLGYDFLFKEYGSKKLFKIYLRITYFVSLIGLLQFIIYLIIQKDFLIYPLVCTDRALPILAGRIIRIRSVAFEPGWLAQTMLPGVIYCIEKILKYKKILKKEMIIILTFLLTFSSGAYVGLFIYFLITRGSNLKKGIKILPGVLLGIILTKNIWFEKVNETVGRLTQLKTGIFNNMNASTYAILTNLYVALNNNNLLLGTGFGTHPYSYFRNLKNYKNIPIYNFYGLNAMDAYSLLTRALSEMGLVIVIIFIYFLFIKYNNSKNLRGLINRCCLGGICSFMIRGGLYTRFGTAFIIIMYFYTGRKKKKYKRRIKC